MVLFDRVFFSKIVLGLSLAIKRGLQIVKDTFEITPSVLKEIDLAPRVDTSHTQRNYTETRPE